jgi:hypothetical protein
MKSGELFARLLSVLILGEIPTPCLGGHNEKVLCGLLGKTKEDLAELEARGVIGHVPLPSKVRDDKKAQGTQKYANS